MNVKAEAYLGYNQAAVIDRLFTAMPEIVKALASPLANVDKITIVSTGNDDASGMNKITADIAKMAAQVPALFETLSGMPLGELLGRCGRLGIRGRSLRWWMRGSEAASLALVGTDECVCPRTSF